MRAAGTCSSTWISGSSGAAVIGPPYLKDQAGLRRSLGYKKILAGHYFGAGKLNSAPSFGFWSCV